MRRRDPYIWLHTNGYYYVIFYDGPFGGQKRMESLRTKNENVARDRLYLWKRQRSQEGDASSISTVCVGQACEEYLKHFSQRSKPASAERYEDALDHLVAFLGRDLPLQAVLVKDLQDYQLFRLEEKANKTTVDYEIDVFRTFLNWCQKRRWVSENVASKDRIDRLITGRAVRATRKKDQVFSDAELSRLLSYPDGHRYWQQHYLNNTLYYTGCRIAEIAHLTRKDIDLGNEEILVQPKTLLVPVWNAQKRCMGTRQVEWTPKSYEERIVPIDPRLLPILREFEAHRTDNIYELYFLTVRGCQVSDHVSRYIKAVAGRQDVSVHTFRHSHISHALNRWGRSPSVVQKWVGHKDLETTQLYLHVSSEDLHREARKTG